MIQFNSKAGVLTSKLLSVIFNKIHNFDRNISIFKKKTLLNQKQKCRALIITLFVFYRKYSVYKRA